VSGHADSLPDDIEALRALALNAIAERDAVIAERDNAIALNDRLRHLLRQANDARFGSKSEKLSRLPPDQLALALEDIEQAIAKSEAIAEKARAHLPRGLRKANRGSLPKHLPHIHETIAPEDRTCPCCRAPMHVIGEETAERLDVIPAQYRVIVTHRPKLACRACEKMVQANAAEHLIKSGLPTEAMVASVLVAKYGWHLPLYRQAKMLAVQGIEIDRSTLAFWVGYAAAEIAPLYERLKESLLASVRLAVDETPVPVLDPGRGKTKKGYFWSMARDDRLFGGADPPAVVYTYAPGRGGVHLHTLLATYRGIVQCDGYAPYKNLPKERITLAFCWAHLRRQSSTSPEKATPPSPRRRSCVSPRSTGSRRRSGVKAPTSGEPFARRNPRRTASHSRRSSTSNSSASRPNRPSPMPSATVSTTGTGLSASSTTAASIWTPTSSNAPCGRRRSRARMRSSPATTTVRRTGPCSPR
jgi:transposase